jgi:hypothetical protein
MHAGARAVSDINENLSLLDYYYKAARVAATMGVGLDYAFKRYVKPHMPPESEIDVMTQAQANQIVGVLGARHRARMESDVVEAKETAK